VSSYNKTQAVDSVNYFTLFTLMLYATCDQQRAVGG